MGTFRRARIQLAVGRIPVCRQADPGMSLEFLAGDVLESSGDALVLAVDGTRRGLEGNIARAFARKWPEEWGEVESRVRYPIPLGAVAGTKTEGACPWKIVVLASTLHHMGILTDEEKIRIASSAFIQALHIANRMGGREVCLAPLSGGWRLERDAAIAVMARSYRAIAASLGGMQVRVYDRQ